MSDITRRLERRLTAELQAAVVDVSGDYSIDTLEELLAAGDINGAQRHLGIDREGRGYRALLAIFLVFMRRAVTATMQAEAVRLGVERYVIPEKLISDAAGHAALAMMRESVATFFATIRRGLGIGMSWREIARALALGVWVFDRSAAALQVQRLNFDEDEKPPEQSEGYRRALINRLRSVAAYWLVFVATLAKRALWRAAIGEGVVDPLEVARMWATAMNEKVCPTCRPLNGRVIGFYEEWPYGPPPIHGHCQCEEFLVAIR